MAEPFFQGKQFIGPSNQTALDMPEMQSTLPMQALSRLWGARLWLGIASKAPLVAEWINADRLYLGNHWPQRRVATWRPDPVSNQIYLLVDEHASQMAASDYDAIFLPRKPSDQEAAEVFSDLWQWWSKRHKIKYWMDDVTVQTDLKGTCLVKIVWDNYAKAGLEGETEEIPPEMLRERRKRRRAGERDITDEDRLAVPVPSAMDGDAVPIVIDPANFFIDPGAYDLQSAAWCGTLTPMLVTEAKQRWPAFAHRFSPEYTFNLSEIYWRPATFQAFQASAGEAGAAYLNVFEGWEKSARVCQCGADKEPEWLDEEKTIRNPRWRPKGHKEGLVRVVMVNAVSGEPIIVERQPHFYRHGKYPFAVFRDIWVPKSFWGQGEPAQVKSLQEMRNRLIEQIAINAYLTANSQKLLMPGSGIDPKTITNEPGKVYPSKVPNALQPIKIDSIPQYVFALLDLTKQDIHEVAGMFSSPPPGVRAGYAVIALLERMAARIKRKSMRMEQGVREVIELVIALYQEFATEARLIRISDEAGQVKFFPFRGTDYADAEFDVDVNLAPNKPFSRAVLQEMVQPLLNARQPDGTPVILPSEYLEIIGFPIQATIRRNRLAEAKYAAQQQAQEQGTMPEGAATLLGQEEMPPAALPTQQVGYRVSPQVQQPGAGQGNGRGLQSRLLEGLGKAGRPGA